MTDASAVPTDDQPRVNHRRRPLSLGLALVSLGLVLSLLSGYANLALDDDLLIESTLGRLAIWMAGQSGNEPEEISSPLAQYADNWANELGSEALDPAILLNSMRNLRIVYLGLIALLLLASTLPLQSFDRVTSVQFALLPS